MQLIALEEHILTPAVSAAWSASASADASTNMNHGDMQSLLADLGTTRIAHMDENGVDVQVLSLTTPALHNLTPDVAIPLAIETNNLLHAAVQQHPTRYQAFATLPVTAPQQAADELRRAVTELGCKGALVCGRVGSKNFDHPDFEPILAEAAGLNVPLYIHPQVPQPQVREALYSGFNPQLDLAFSAFGIGWHYEAGIQFIRLILAGVFDRYPNLQIILGHWGEVVLFYLERLKNLSRFTTLHRSIEDCVKQNLYITPGGVWSQTYLQQALAIVGPERLLFAADYPYQYRPGNQPRAFLNEANLTQDQKAQFAHANWQRLTSQAEG